MNILFFNINEYKLLSITSVLLSVILLSGQSPAKPTTPTSDLQFEELTANSLPPCVESDVADAGASNGSRSNFAAFAENHWVEYSVYVEAPGTYSIEVTSKNGADRGKYQLFIDGTVQGNELDQYSATSVFVTTDLGNVTFLNPGYKIFKFLVTGQNKESSGYVLSFDKMELKEVDGFTLLSPNKAYTGHSQPVLRWNAWPGASQYDVYVDGNLLATVPPTATSHQASGLTIGPHEWYVASVDGSGNSTSSNILPFTIGDAPLYPHRDFSDDFESGNLSGYSVSGMTIAKSALSGNRSLKGSAESGVAYASVKDVTLQKIAVGEVSATVRLGSSKSKAGVGFRADDGTFIYALADADTGRLLIERRVQGYSILDTRVTPYEYQITDWEKRDPPSVFHLNDWTEEMDGDWYVWTMDYDEVDLNPSASYKIILSFSRRSMAVMAVLKSEDGSILAVVRDMSDLRIMDHPAAICTDGTATFDDFAYERLDAETTNWDPDSVRVVLRPTAGTWDEKAAMNPAVVFKDGVWHMIYRGQAVPTPGDIGKPYEDAQSEIGYATSTDGIHWTKYAGNPVIHKEPESDSIEDPDIVEGDDGYYYMELRDHDPHDGETMWRSKDFINWKHVADIPRPAEDLPGKGWKMGAFLDTHTSPLYNSSNPEAVEIPLDGIYYRYLAFVERGRFMVTNDLKDPSPDNWKYHTRYADFNTKPRTEWCPLEYDKNCAGDAFYDVDGNIRITVQSSPDFNVGGQPECTNLEIIVDGNEPWKVLHTSRLPWLQGYYGHAVTGVLDEYTAWDGSTFPGDTIEHDGWLWQYSGANNTFVSLVKAYNRHLFEYRNLTLSDFTPDADQSVTVSVTARNVGNIAGTGDVELKVDGVVVDTQSVTLEKNEETVIEFSISKPSGTHTVSVGTASATMVVGEEDGQYFANGIKIGEVDQNSAIIWTRLTSIPALRLDGPSFLDVGKDPVPASKQLPEGKGLYDMEGAVPGAAGEVRIVWQPVGGSSTTSDWVAVDADTDYSTRFNLKGLEPVTEYLVRLEARSGAFFEGSFKTAPPIDAVVPVTFSVVTGSRFNLRDNKEMGHTAFKSMDDLDPDFFVHTGDIEYFDKDFPWSTNVEFARFRFSRIFGLPYYVEFHRSTPSYFIKDDHDTLDNDCSPGDVYGELTYARGIELFREHFPVLHDNYRTIRWGKDLQIWMVEGRDYRSRNDMPDGPEKTIWGAKQKKWFFDTVKASDATFRVLVSPTPLVGPDNEGKADNHSNPAFQTEGDELRKFIASQKNMFIACGDRHWQYISVDHETGAKEFCSGNVTAKDKEYDGPDPFNEHVYASNPGGFMTITVERVNGKPILTCRHYDVRGKVVNEDMNEWES